ncbi:MAG: 1-acyl-sn-glycerol-3-phosphate acyltransferase [Marinilabiliales bacterium]
MPEAVQINLREVFKSKNPKLAKKIPGFVFRMIEKLVKQDEMNLILSKHKDKFGLDFVNAVLNEFQVTAICENEEKIPKTGRYIFAGNHPLGALESHVMMKFVGKYHNNIRFLVNDLLLYLKNYSPIFVPINKHGAQSKDAAKQIEETFESDAQILYFPAGLVSRKIKGKIIDLEWKKSFINRAVRYKRDIVPVYLDGKNSNFFYNFANFRKMIGIKSNIEMILLPREMFKQKGKTIRIIFGKPIPWQTFDKSKNANEWAQYVKEVVYQIPSNKD